MIEVALHDIHKTYLQNSSQFGYIMPPHSLLKTVANWVRIKGKRAASPYRGRCCKLSTEKGNCKIALFTHLFFMISCVMNTEFPSFHPVQIWRISMNIRSLA